ncbi:leucyl/phenylalanyl-tRNA--protein transferase [Anthocerotibacter panamensis]|uniref:leucyl/phenylalanyl-tRNA--protein transferase n=1 Tax=Anthocerotibacter panamensis TaxID=2857077 RepID=UPI001C406195|nr:leucyl/phenylalanyl-tRNA--protein transferase [Anthocerotibacter panamensis]
MSAITPAMVLWAYGQGYFPMAEGEEIFWLDPDPRAIFDLDTVHFSRRLLRRIRQGQFTVTYNHCCALVIQRCAERRKTWLSAAIQQTYCQLHELGHVHSVEVWQDGLLAGGLYGVTLGALFSGESMFHRVTDASKVALYYLVERLRERGYRLLDAQLLNDHTASLGAVHIPRRQYRELLQHALSQDCHFT